MKKNNNETLLMTVFMVLFVMCIVLVSLYLREPTYAEIEQNGPLNANYELLSEDLQISEMDILKSEKKDLKAIETKQKLEEKRELERNEKEKEEARQKYISEHSAGRGPYNYPDSSYIDIVQMKTYGVRYFNGWKFTTYSEYVLPGGGLKIPGRHHDEYFVRDAEENICVASSDLKWGTYIMTPWGQGRVYDSGCSHGTIDIYVSEITFRSYGR